MIYKTNSSDETQALGRSLARHLTPGMVFGLEGGLGSGKTELVRGVMDALNPSAVVRSPSFSLVNTYDTPKFLVHHFDFYRLNEGAELWEIGFDEYINPDSVAFIEWAQICADQLPKDLIYIAFTEAVGDSRIISIDFEEQL